jgi:hypothetical protein
VTLYEKKPEIVNAVQWDPQNQQPMIDLLVEKEVEYTLIDDVLRIFSAFAFRLVPIGTYVVITRGLISFTQSAQDMSDLYEEIV